MHYFSDEHRNSIKLFPKPPDEIPRNNIVASSWSTVKSKFITFNLPESFDTVTLSSYYCMRYHKPLQLFYLFQPI